MAKKSPASSKPTSAPAKSAGPVSTTAVRNSAIPPKTVAAAAKKAPVSHDQIAVRAYEIWRSGQGGSQDDNWFRAERELRGV